jgi:hypothetical protein
MTAESAPKAASVREPQPPVDGDHALRIGWVSGALVDALLDQRGIATTGVTALLDVDGNYLDAVRVEAPSGTYLVSIEKEN